MAVPPKKVHVFTAGGQKYSVMAPDYYANISDATGLREIADTDNDAQNDSDVSDLLQQGLLFRINATVKGADGKRYRARLLCSQDNVKTVKARIKGKELYGGRTITGASFPRRRVLR